MGGSRVAWMAATVGIWLCLGTRGAWAGPKRLVPPFTLQWGATPDAVANVLSRLLRPLGDGSNAATPAQISPGDPGPMGTDGSSGQNLPPDAVPGSGQPQAPGSTPVVPATVAATTGLYMTEQHYEGEIYAARADRITPLFLMSQLFGVMAHFPSAPGSPSSLLWERIVEQVSREYGPPKARSKPLSLISWNAILQVVPPDANKSALLRVYNEAEANPQTGLYVLQDLQVQTGLWVPEAIWSFKDGGVIKVVMQASGRNEFGLLSVRPLLVILKHDMFR